MLIAQNPGLIQGTFPPVSNAADFLCDLSVTNDETGDGVDLSGATISVIVEGDACGVDLLTATTDNGKITLGADAGDFRFSFTDEEMSGLPAGSYRIGVMIELDGIRYQLVLADLPVVRGIGL